MERYHVDTDRWEMVQPMTERRWDGAGISLINGRIHVLGRMDGHNTIECYNPADGTWDVVGHLQTSVRQAGTAVTLTIARGLGEGRLD